MSNEDLKFIKENSVKRIAKIKMHEDKEFTGPLAKFLEETKQYRIPSIHNEEYSYIKEIIWDSAKQSKYGKERSGYEEFKQDSLKNGLNIGFSGIHSLREVKDKHDNIIEYVLESKKTENNNLNELIRIYNDAREELYTILDVKDKETFDYYVDYNIIEGYFRLEANTIIDRLKDLEKMINEYNSDEFYKRYIDKIKG
jgi:hypothetical protein